MTVWPCVHMKWPVTLTAVLQGCIAEQGIHHTCGMSHLEALTHRMIISPDQLTAPVHFTDSPTTYLQHNGHHHSHHHAPPAHAPHCHNKLAPPVKYPSSVAPQWCTRQGNGGAKPTNSSSATKPNKKTPSPAQKQTQHVEYVYRPEQPLENIRYINAPVDGSAPQGMLEMPYQPYHLVHHPLQYPANQRMPLVAPLMPSPQTFMSCPHGSYGDILYAAEQYHRMCNPKPSPDNPYQQYHLVKHMYNVPVGHSHSHGHGNIMYNDTPTFINSGVMQDLCASSVPSPHCVEGATQKVTTCDAPEGKNHDVATTKTKSVSTEGLYNNVALSSPRRGSTGSGRSTSSRSTPESPILHRVDKRRSLAGETRLLCFFTLWDVSLLKVHFLTYLTWHMKMWVCMWNTVCSNAICKVFSKLSSRCHHCTIQLDWADEKCQSLAGFSWLEV